MNHASNDYRQGYASGREAAHAMLDGLRDKAVEIVQASITWDATQQFIEGFLRGYVDGRGE